MAKNNNAEMLRCTLDLMILKLLVRRTEHGFAIARLIQKRSNELLQVEEGTLYPALHRLEKKGLLNSHWEQTKSNRRAKYYSLTENGRKELTEKQKQWKKMSLAVNRVLGIQA